MFLAKKLNRGAGTPAPKDAQFNYVTMLLHGDGTNGAQNNTFVDSSTNNFTITRNGNTTQGSFSPYGSNWSNFFGTAQHKLSTTGMTALGSDFTLELWIFPTSFNDYNTIFDNRLADGDPAGLVFGLTSAAKVYFYTNLAFQITTTTALSLNTWTHIALVRSGSGSGNVKIYINGVADATTATYTTSFTSTVPSIGDDWGTRGFLQYFGYLSNLRAVTSALYTSTFTPSTTPLTAISGTVLLTCQSNRFIDNSSSALTMTVTGTPSVQRFNPFGTSTAYSTSVIGGSGYFDGTGDYLSLASDAAFGFGTGDFTVEFWLYVNSFTTYQTVVATRESGSPNDKWSIAYDSGGSVYLYSNTFFGQSATSAIKVGTWTHVAIVRASSSIKTYVNGTQSGSTSSNTQNFATSALGVGAAPAGTEPMNGYISNLRLVKGTAVYTANFTSPTAQVTAISGTSLLTNFTNGAIFDNAMMNNLETVGNAQISTSVYKYGTGSLYFDGTGDFLKFPKMGILGFGTGNFTIEMWVNPSANQASYGQLINKGPSEIFQLNFLPSTTTLSFYDGGFLITASSSLTIGAWTHVALVRNNGTLTLYQGGVSVGSTTYTTNVTDDYGHIGCDVTESGYFYNGYIDDLRITKGYARYTTTFTPPTAALPDIGPV